MKRKSSRILSKGTLMSSSIDIVCLFDDVKTNGLIKRLFYAMTDDCIYFAYSIIINID